MKTLHKQIKSHLKDLRLSTIKRHFEELAEDALKNSWSYEEYLYELLSLERDQKLQNRTERFLKLSRIPTEKSLANFDMKRLPQKIVHQFRLLREGDFLDRNENVLVFGTPGSGKTHLCCALCQELIQKGRKVLMTKGSLLAQELLQSRKEFKLPAVIKRYQSYDAIFIDDLGYVQQTQREMEVLFTLLSERYEKGSLLITSNLPFSKWEKIFKDPMMTAAAIDRLIHHSIIIELNLKSYRMEAKQQLLKNKGRR